MTSLPDGLSAENWVSKLSGTYYGMAFLGLANAAYTSENLKNRKTISEHLKTAIEQANYTPPLPGWNFAGSANPDPMPGNWKLDWGPAIAEDFSNLVYIASYRDPGGSPYFYVVGIRGTDVLTKPLGVVDQIIQDFDAFSMKDWGDILTKGVFAGSTFYKPPYHPTKTDSHPTGKVATGSFHAFHKLATTEPLKEYGEHAVLQALIGLLGGKATPVVVTGHSLGGCQTQTMTSYLTWQLPNNPVISHAFAPSTAGDAGFASKDYFKQGCFWYNTLDLVPCAFQKSSDKDYPDTKSGDYKLQVGWAANTLWSTFTWPKESAYNPGQDAPELPLDKAMKAAVFAGGLLIEAAHFTRPCEPATPVRSCVLTGNIPTSQHIYDLLGIDMTHPDTAMLMWQHFPPNYRELMWAQYGSEMAYFNFSTYHA